MADDCDVAWFVDGRLEHSFVATTVRADSTTVVVDALAEPLADRIQRIERRKGRVLSVRHRQVQAGDLYGVVHRLESEARWGTRVAVVRVDSPVSITSCLTDDQCGLFALQLHHGVREGVGARRISGSALRGPRPR